MNAMAGRPPAGDNRPKEPEQPNTARPVNPYRCSAAIRDPSDFYGRTSELRRVFDALRKWECINVVGERRSGKTSFLLHIAHPEVQRRYAQDNADALFVYLDAEVLPQEPCEFFRAFIARARANWPEMACTVDEHNLQSETCERQVLRFLQEMLPRRLVLLVDEFEGITQCPAFPLRFFEFLRGLSQAYNISYVVATRQNLKQSCSQENIISPFFNIFRPVTMGPFTPDEFDCFLSETAFRCSLPIYRAREQILRLAGYQPYLDQMACSCYFDAYVDRHDPNYLEALERRFREEAEPYFDSVWNTYLSAEERRALQLLAHGSQVRDANSLSLLEKAGHLCAGRIASEPFAEFIRRQEILPELRAQLLSALSENDAVAQQGIVVDERTGQVYLDGQVLDPPLPENQFRLLALLFRNRGKICDSYEVVSAVWGSEYLNEVDDQRIAQLFTRLRRRIEPGERPWKHVITVHGRGWTLGTGDDAPS